MPATRLSFILHASDLSNTWKFWTAIGITSDEGADRPGPWLTDEHDSLDTMGLPRATGEIGGVEFLFFRRPGTPPGSWPGPAHTLITIYYDDHGCAGRAVEELKAAGLFVPGPEFDPSFNICVIDPDGRLLHLADPHPWRL